MFVNNCVPNHVLAFKDLCSTCISGTVISGRGSCLFAGPLFVCPNFVVLVVFVFLLFILVPEEGCGTPRNIFNDVF